MSALKGFHHIAVMTTKFDESFAFYRDLLGLPVMHAWQSGPRRLCLLATDPSNPTGGPYVELIECASDAPEPESHSAHPIAHLTFRVDDVDDAIEPIREAGCQITIEPKDAMLGDASARLAFFTGPNDETIEFLASEAV